MRFEGAKDIVVPGGLIQVSITGIFGTEFSGDGCLGLSFVSERFRKPVFPGDEIDVVVEVAKVRGALIEVDVLIQDQAGEKISAAKSKLLGSDEGYRNWWWENS